MAKINAPLFSLDTSGSLNKSITFRKKSKNQIASKYSKPGDKIPFESSPKQKDQRGIIGLITARWQSFSTATKSTWNDMAKLLKKPITGYSYFIRLSQTDLLYYLGLCAYWSMNYNIAANIPDLSGNNNDGLLSPTYPNDCPLLVDSINSKYGKSAKFDGLNDLIRINNSVTLRPLIYSLELWLKPLALVTPESGGVLFRKLDYGAKEGLFIDWNNTKQIDYFYGNGISWGNITSSVNSSPLDKWIYLLAIYNGTQHNLYINNKLEGSNTFGFVTSTDEARIGAEWTNFKRFNGLIDEVRLWNRVLSPEEANAHYFLFR